MKGKEQNDYLKNIKNKVGILRSSASFTKEIKAEANEKEDMKMNVSTFEMKAKNLSHTHLKHQKIFIHPEISINDVGGKMSYNNGMC